MPNGRVGELLCGNALSLALLPERCTQGSAGGPPPPPATFYRLQLVIAKLERGSERSDVGVRRPVNRVDQRHRLFLVGMLELAQPVFSLRGWTVAIPSIGRGDQ